MNHYFIEHFNTHILQTQSNVIAVYYITLLNCYFKITTIEIPDEKMKSSYLIQWQL